MRGSEGGCGAVGNNTTFSEPDSTQWQASEAAGIRAAAAAAAAAVQGRLQRQGPLHDRRSSWRPAHRSVCLHAQAATEAARGRVCKHSKKLVLPPHRTWLRRGWRGSDGLIGSHITASHGHRLCRATFGCWHSPPCLQRLPAARGDPLIAPWCRCSAITRRTARWLFTPHAALLPLPLHGRAAGSPSMSASGGDAPADCLVPCFHYQFCILQRRAVLRLRPNFKLEPPPCRPRHAAPAVLPELAKASCKAGLTKPKRHACMSGGRRKRTGITLKLNDRL